MPYLRFLFTLDNLQIILYACNVNGLTLTPRYAYNQSIRKGYNEPRQLIQSFEFLLCVIKVCKFVFIKNNICLNQVFETRWKDNLLPATYF